jgi:transposase
MASSGGVVAQRSVRANARGYTEAMRFAGAHALGARVWAVEGAGHYGAGLARYLSSRGETVHEVSSTARGERRLQGKDDLLDVDPRGARGAREHSTSAAAVWGAARGSAPALARPTQRRRRAPDRDRPAPQRDRDRTRELARPAAAAAAGRAAAAL